jgi:hypothetical protein
MDVEVGITVSPGRIIREMIALADRPLRLAGGLAARRSGVWPASRNSASACRR